MGAILARIFDVAAREPVVVIGVVDALIVLAVSLGAPIDEGQKLAVDGLLAALGVLLARSQVTPA